jgi:hypothetical protein
VLGLQGRRQCAKGVCNRQNRCGAAEVPNACEWDYECANHHCGREGREEDVLTCCKNAQHCSPFGFDWCAGYGKGEACKYDCQCVSDECTDGRCE